MRLLNHIFIDLDTLSSFINNEVREYNSILIQVFSGTDNITLVQNILNTLKKTLPTSSIIGASTSGEIINGGIIRNSILISFALFQDTEVELFHFNDTNFITGRNSVSQIVRNNTKAVISFAESLKGDAESFLEGFSSICPDIPIAGGNAADNDAFKSVYIIKDTEILYDGIVIATLNSEKLKVSNNYILEWTPVGKEMTVTNAKDNIIYEIDGIKAIDIYTKYLGNDTVKELPASAVEFPFIKNDDGVNVARSMVAEGENGSLIYAGHFKNGDKIRFAIGNLEEIVNKAPIVQKAMASFPVEGTFVYSCTVRKLFLKEHLQYELGLINDVAPSIGFFTYGEFYHGNLRNQLLNVTTTTLSLSENDKLAKNVEVREYHSQHSMLKALSHLVNETQSELNESINFLNQYKIALDSNSVVSKTDPKGLITYVNDEFCRISGYSKDELIGRSHSILRHPENTKEFFKEMWNTIQNKQIWKGTFKNLAKDKSEYYVKSVIIPILNEDNHIVEYIAARTDVTELIKKDKLIKEQFNDDLTGLNNRVALLSKLKSSKESHTLLLLNIDRFSDINNYFGYEIGDEVLKTFAQRLLKKVVNGKIHRVSGDEFAVLFENQNYAYATLKSHILDIIDKLENSSVKVKGISTNISFACGVAYGSSDILYKLAHMALKATKTRNENVAFYNQSDLQNQNIKTNIETINKIQNAIKTDSIIPYFQGIVNNQTKQIEKYECLIRLKETDGKILSPYFFIEHSKKAKLYDKLTQIMITKSFEMFANTNFEFSINLTMQDIASKETKQILFENLLTYNCSSRVVLEIVESESISNFDEVVSFISSIKKLGCKIAIDDFGTGYSNFEYLIKLKADYLKIDGSLIKNIEKGNDSYMVVTTITEFAKKLGMQVIAEFVENERIYDIINEIGIDYPQGYFFSIPKETL
ncbi:MAG: EAL domain-containing protein [Arcobacteraceae bacterium]|jgi:diguanylate cyclase (GGDEF)-like protein/PAS domain S-box-containing protein|nr:EAL domain-containing protein [Arcobacteraceae bacterium]